MLLGKEARDVGCCSDAFEAKEVATVPRANRFTVAAECVEANGTG